jgi:hypothetical protein
MPWMADSNGSADVVAVQDDVRLQGMAPFEPTAGVEAEVPMEADLPVHVTVEAPQRVDCFEGFSTPKKIPTNSTSVRNFSVM